MTASLGHKTGHDSLPGFSWEDYIAWLVGKRGSLAAVASHVSAQRGYKDDSATIERALRRLRSRGNLDGGRWGIVLLHTFGLPDAAEARTRWMGMYHSRFNDLPLPFCLDLLRLWDRPPMNEAPTSRCWLILGYASCALRNYQMDEAITHLDRMNVALSKVSVEAVIEHGLVRAFISSTRDRPSSSRLLSTLEPLFAQPMDATDRACLYARWIDQQAYELNRGRDGAPPNYLESERLYRTIDEEHAPAFARCRKANGLAYVLWKQKQIDQAIEQARLACQYAGDGGHLRLRAMSLNMYARIVGGAEGETILQRAKDIAAQLDDEALKLRFSRPLPLQK